MVCPHSEPCSLEIRAALSRLESVPAAPLDGACGAARHAASKLFQRVLSQGCHSCTSQRGQHSEGGERSRWHGVQQL
eukprot:1161555-Pelagomonas_calceolata.AAC.14